VGKTTTAKDRIYWSKAEGDAWRMQQKRAVRKMVYEEQPEKEGTVTGKK
jgi:hypothetical protein